jgi:hypothetical protein
MQQATAETPVSRSSSKKIVFAKKKCETEEAIKGLNSALS